MTPITNEVQERAELNLKMCDQLIIAWALARNLEKQLQEKENVTRNTQRFEEATEGSTAKGMEV